MPGAATSFTVIGHLAPDASVTQGSDSQPATTATLTWQSAVGGDKQVSDARIRISAAADLGLVSSAVSSEENETEVALAVAGKNIRFRHGVTNHGPSDAAGPITVMSNLPGRVTFAGLTEDSARYWSAEVDSVDPQLAVFTQRSEIPQLGANATSTAILYDLPLGSDLRTTGTSGSQLVSTAVAQSSTPEPTSASHTHNTRMNLNIERQADLEVATLGSDTTAQVG